MGGRTSGTRPKGSGIPAKGAGYGPSKNTTKAPPFGKDNNPTPEAKSAGWDVAREIRERIAARKNEILDAQFARATDVDHPQGHQAAADLLNRVMPPESRQDLTSGGEKVGPLVIMTGVPRSPDEV